MIIKLKINSESGEFNKRLRFKKRVVRVSLRCFQRQGSVVLKLDPKCVRHRRISVVCDEAQMYMCFSKYLSLFTFLYCSFHMYQC